MTAACRRLTARNKAAALAAEQERALDLLLLLLLLDALIELPQRQLLVEVALRSLAGSLQAGCQS
jgi:hypothetical protein